VQHALRQALTADAHTLQLKLPPPGAAPPAARAAPTVAGGAPVVEGLAVTSVWCVQLLKMLAQVGPGREGKTSLCSLACSSGASLCQDAVHGSQQPAAAGLSCMAAALRRASPPPGPAIPMHATHPTYFKSSSEKSLRADVAPHSSFRRRRSPAAARWCFWVWLPCRPPRSLGGPLKTPPA
jgi:hypothetical protein